MGVATVLFDAVCAGCHGSLSGRELDVMVTPDALTGASESIAQGQAPTNLAP
jgi:mono/diheme cytochrome c family protein